VCTAIVGTRKAIALRLRVIASMVGQSRDDYLKGHGRGRDDKGEVSKGEYRTAHDNPDGGCKHRGLSRDCHEGCWWRRWVSRWHLGLGCAWSQR